MERLTEKAVGCFEYALKDHKAVLGEFGTYEAFFDYSMAVKRLGHYEDTGLEPEEIKEHEAAYIEIMTRTYGPLHQKIGQWLQAEQDGRMVVLPCKVGDTVYVIGESCDFCETYLDEPERCMRCEKGHYVEERGFELWMLSALNESIFLTREEAEAALAGKGGEG